MYVRVGTVLGSLPHSLSCTNVPLIVSFSKNFGFLVSFFCLAADLKLVYRLLVKMWYFPICLGYVPTVYLLNGTKSNDISI